MLFFAALLVASTVGAQGYTPKSPKVRAMINGGLAFLENPNSPDSPYSKSLGGRCLVALAFVKGGDERQKRHKLVNDAVAKCQTFCKRGAQGIVDSGPKDEVVYSTAIALLFLCSLEDTRTAPGLKYRPEIETLIKSFELRQKAHGGFGYPQKTIGDTSMTQYAVLCYWEAMAIGVEPSRRSIRQVTNWLIRTQDPSGAFGYQAADPGNFTPINQSGVRLSMGVAGTGSLYIAGDLLGLTQSRGADSDGLPPALRIKPKEVKRPKAAAVGVDRARLQRAKSKGNAWIRKNFTIDPPGFIHYYLYTLERYQSFREKADGNSGTGWYDAGVKFLGRSQSESGSWNSQGGPKIDTAFAVLFLARATQASIIKGDPRQGQLSGRKPLAKKIIAGVEEQMKILEAGPRHPDYFDVVDDRKELRAITDRAKLRSLSERFRRILAGGAPSARLIAAEALGKVRDLDNVPTLIYGLTDPNWNVVAKSRDSLRLISRRFEGFGIPDKRPIEGVDADVAMLKAIGNWKAWYRSVRPDAEFLK
jgi:hypothetical protein